MGNDEKNCRRRNARAYKVKLAPISKLAFCVPSTEASSEENEELKNELEISKSFCFQLADGNKLTNKNIFEVLLSGDKQEDESLEVDKEIEKPWQKHLKLPSLNPEIDRQLRKA